MGRAGTAGVDLLLMLYAARTGSRRFIDRTRTVSGCRARGHRGRCRRSISPDAGSTSAFTTGSRSRGSRVTMSRAPGKHGGGRRIHPGLSQRLWTIYATAAAGLCPRSPGIAPGSSERFGQRDSADNGSYLVFRQLRQDVAAFWRTLDAKTARARWRSGSCCRGLALAAKMVGRWPSGAPLVKTPDQDDPAMADDDRFLYYGAGDPHGFNCPLGSHIRRTNPRDALDRIRLREVNRSRQATSHRPAGPRLRPAGGAVRWSPPTS